MAGVHAPAGDSHPHLEELLHQQSCLHGRYSEPHLQQQFQSCLGKCFCAMIHRLRRGPASWQSSHSESKDISLRPL